MNDEHRSSIEPVEQPKRQWQTPSLEELDLSATEVGPIFGLPIDAALYTV